MNLRIVIVAENASAKFGGEAVLPLHYYRILRRREIPVWLVVHERIREELSALFPHDKNIIYVAETKTQYVLWRLGSLLPSRLSYFTADFLMRLITQMMQRRIVCRLVKKEKINIIHQPIPVSPKEPSMIFGMGVPVVIGPMNGGMDYPPAFQKMQSPVTDLAVLLGRKFSNFVNYLIPGKQQAALLLVANERTRQALPKGSCEKVIELVENGVDLSLWNPSTLHTAEPLKKTGMTRYVFMGRLVDWKAVDLLLIAFKQATLQTSSISLTIIGEGIERKALEQKAQELDLLTVDPSESNKVLFTGWLSQEKCSQQLQNHDALVLSSLRECGGAVVLEAMATGRPVIATDWGGPSDYLDSSCGILINPTSRENFIGNLTDAIVKLAESPQDRENMGRAGKARVKQFFDWEVKANRMVEIYEQVVEAR